MILSRTSGHIRVGLDSIKNAKLRSFWTMLGIIIGITSVISIVAIGEGIKSQVSGQLHQYGPNLITVRSAALNTGPGSSSSNVGALAGLSISGPLTIKDINTVNHVSGVNASAPLTLVSGLTKGDNGIFKGGFVLGTSNDLPSLLNQSLSFGSFFTSDIMGSNIAVLGQNAASSLFNENVPLGRSFSFHGQNFVVVGIFNQFNTAPLSQQTDFNNAIFIPNDVAESLTDNTAPTYEILAKSNNSNLTKQTAANIESALSSTHGGYSGFSVLTGNQNVNTNNSILDLLTRLIAGVAAISLVVAGIGIMNVMLVSVAERVREIGIRKAVGATNKQILSQFLTEASIISFIGGILGIALSYAIDLVIKLTTNLRPIISWQIVVIATAISLIVGIVFGSVPAIKAARKDPIDALRAE